MRRFRGIVSAVDSELEPKDQVEKRPAIPSITNGDPGRMVWFQRHRWKTEP